MCSLVKTSALLKKSRLKLHKSDSKCVAFSLDYEDAVNKNLSCVCDIKVHTKYCRCVSVCLPAIN